MLNVKKLLTKVLNSIKVDYIIEQGSTGAWTYRKWKSGKVEAWAQNLDLGSQTGAVWVSPIRYKDLTGALPSELFPSAPILQVTSGTNQWWVNNANATSATAFTTRCCTLSSSAATVYLNVYAKTW